MCFQHICGCYLSNKLRIPCHKVDTPADDRDSFPLYPTCNVTWGGDPVFSKGSTKHSLFSKNATIGYSLESVCVCVFLHDNSKRNPSRNTKSEYIVVYENSSDEFDIELHRIKVKVTVGIQTFSPFTTIQTVRSYSSTLVQARNLILAFIFI